MSKALLLSSQTLKVNALGQECSQGARDGLGSKFNRSCWSNDRRNDVALMAQRPERMSGCPRSFKSCSGTF